MGEVSIRVRRLVTFRVREEEGLLEQGVRVRVRVRVRDRVRDRVRVTCSSCGMAPSMLSTKGAPESLAEKAPMYTPGWR